jgi:hypothetical protein
MDKGSFDFFVFVGSRQFPAVREIDIDVTEVTRNAIAHQAFLNVKCGCGFNIVLPLAAAANQHAKSVATAEQQKGVEFANESGSVIGSDLIAHASGFAAENRDSLAELIEDGKSA